MSLLRATAIMVFPPLLVGMLTLAMVRAMNASAYPSDDWVAIFLAMMLGAMTWIGCWTWIRIQLRKEENT
jgi:positive regulator of sigma E activity